MRPLPVAVALAALILMAMPTAGADHAPAPRNIDTRVLLDTTASGDYGRLADDGALFYEGGHDIVALDIREAYGPQGQPGLWLRLLHRVPSDGDVGSDLEDTITFTAGGEPITLGLATADGTTYTPTGAMEWVGEPEDLGSGITAVDGFSGYARLGVTPGDALTGFEVAAKIGDAVKDFAPGTYMLAGQALPAQPTGGEPGTQADHTLAGPARLLAAAIHEQAIDLRTANGTLPVTLVVTNEADLVQRVTVELAGPDGLKAVAATLELELEPQGVQEIRIDVTPSETVGAGDLRVTVFSDLGGLAFAQLPILGATGTDDNLITPLLRTGESYDHTFTSAGEFQYHCHPHPFMQAVITIEAAPNGSSPQTHTVRMIEGDPQKSATWGFEPASLTIHVGDTVRWVNEGSHMHNIHGGLVGAEGGHDHDDHGHDHGSHDHGEEGEGLPGLPVVGVLVGVALALVLRRR